MNIFKSSDISTELVSGQNLATFEDTILDKRFIDPIRIASYSLLKADKQNAKYEATMFVNSTAQESGLYFGNLLT